MSRFRNPWFWANVWLACFWVGLSVGSGDYAIWMKYAAVSAGFSAVIFWLTDPQDCDASATADSRPLAAKFNVVTSTIYRIRRGERGASREGAQ